VSKKEWKKLKGWKEKTLIGKEVFLMAFVRVIPNYILSCYKISIKICEQMEIETDPPTKTSFSSIIHDL